MCKMNNNIDFYMLYEEDYNTYQAYLQLQALQH